MDSLDYNIQVICYFVPSKFSSFDIQFVQNEQMITSELHVFPALASIFFIKIFPRSISVIFKYFLGTWYLMDTGYLLDEDFKKAIDQNR